MGRTMRPGKSRESGFTLIAVMAALLLLGLASQGVMQVVSQQALREREARLIRVGQAYQRAIGSYYESSPGRVKRWPPSLNDLLDDRRFVGIRRHLRELYEDPIARSAVWGTVRALDGGIAGVYSLAEGRPIQSAAGAAWPVPVQQAQRYSDWLFVYQPPGDRVMESQ